MNVERSSIIYEYEQILLGKNHAFVANFGANTEQNEKIIVYLWRYVVEELLHWTPSEAVTYLTMETVEQLHLQNTIKKIDTPAGISKSQLPKYVLSLCYPNQVIYSTKEQVIDEYVRVLSKDNANFAKNYFDDALGLKKASYCLNYAVSTFLSDYNIHQLYDLFGDTDKAKDWLERHKLLYVQDMLFPTPLDFYHYTCLKNSNFLYLSHRLNASMQ